MKKLTPRQRMFVEAYAGNATAAAIAAGYSEKTAKAQGSRLLTYADVKRAIAARETKATAKHIATRTELQEFWSSTMAAPRKTSLRDKLRASELLAKSRGEFTQKIEVRGELTLLDLVKESMGEKPREPVSARASTASAPEEEPTE